MTWDKEKEKYHNDPKYREKILEQKREYYRKNKVKKKQWNQKYYETHKKYLRKVMSKNNAEIRKKALQIISGLIIPICVNCGCDNLKFLEVNHKNGGGRKESFKKSGQHLCRKIVKGKRKVHDLEVTCRVCNAYHYINKKFGVKYKIEYLQ